MAVGGGNRGARNFAARQSVYRNRRRGTGGRGSVSTAERSLHAVVRGSGVGRAVSRAGQGLPAVLAALAVRSHAGEGARTGVRHRVVPRRNRGAGGARGGQLPLPVDRVGRARAVSGGGGQRRGASRPSRSPRIVRAADRAPARHRRLSEGAARLV